MVWLVADCGARPYQPTQNYKRVVTLQISTNTAINYTTGYSQLFIFNHLKTNKMKQEINFLACEHLDFSDSYSAKKDAISTKFGTKICWNRLIQV